MKFPKRIHLVPVGNDKINLILNPIKETLADRIYLITRNESDRYRNRFEDIKTKILEDHHERIEIISKFIDIFDFPTILETYANIIQSEQAHGNMIYILLSSGGNLMAAAGMLACNLFGCTPYFYMQGKNQPLGKDTFEYIPIPSYKIEPPSEILIRFLNELQKITLQNPEETIHKKNCLAILQKIHPNEALSHTSGDYNKLNFRYLKPLTQLKYIHVEEKPRGRVQITAEGTFALRIFASYYHL